MWAWAPGSTPPSPCDPSWPASARATASRPALWRACAATTCRCASPAPPSPAARRRLAGAVDDLSAYQRAVDRRLQPELSVSRKLQELFHFAPPPYVAVMRRSEKFWRLFCHLI